MPTIPALVHRTRSVVSLAWRAWPALVAAVLACSSSSSTVKCIGGQAACDGVCVDTQTDPGHCGACGNACSVLHALPACVKGACTVDTCLSGYAVCAGNPAQGCPIDLRTDIANCGACGNACALPNATAACQAGLCAIVTCDANFADCDMSAVNGCEVDTLTDPYDCGACENSCDADGGFAVCANGHCS